MGKITHSSGKVLSGSGCILVFKAHPGELVAVLKEHWAQDLPVFFCKKGIHELPRLKYQLIFFQSVQA